MFFIIIGLLLTQSLYATERIIQFKSDITVHVNGALAVREDITVNAELNQIRRGITREFPTQYKDRAGNFYNVGFEISTVLMDGAPCPYFVESVSNGKVINFGDDSFLKTGKHTFTVVYATMRHVGFFENHDELYWNVTGDEQTVPTGNASALIYLPQGVPQNEVQKDCYAGIRKNY